MLMRTDPSPNFRLLSNRGDPVRESDRLTRQVFGTPSRPAVVPMDAYRSGDEFVIHFDLPGVEPDTIDLDIERNVLTVHAERRFPAPEGAELLAAERPSGRFDRQLVLGETLDTDRIEAAYEAGVLTLRVPVAEQAKPRRIRIAAGDVTGQLCR